jgi:hypothetical protein
MSRVAAGQFDFDLRVFLTPEIRQVVGHLDGGWFGASTSVFNGTRPSAKLELLLALMQASTINNDTPAHSCIHSALRVGDGAAP